LGKVRAKKHLGQHFLKDPSIAEQTADAFGVNNNFKFCLEIGPGMGILTEALVKRSDLDVHVIDIDRESIEFLSQNEVLEDEKIIEGDFLQLDLQELSNGQKMGIIGNFPYNISTQILFKLYEHRDHVLELVGMFQKEVAERVVSPPGSKVYGITSVLLQAFFDVEYLFTIDEDEFDPPPKVKSAVIRLKRNQTNELGCDVKLFKKIVKAAFNQRRKTLKNGIKAFTPEGTSFSNPELLSKRPEQLSVADFVQICSDIEAMS